MKRQSQSSKRLDKAKKVLMDEYTKASPMVRSQMKVAKALGREMRLEISPKNQGVMMMQIMACSDYAWRFEPSGTGDGSGTIICDAFVEQLVPVGATDDTFQGSAVTRVGGN